MPFLSRIPSLLTRITHPNNRRVRRHVYRPLESPKHIRLIVLHPALSKDAPLEIAFASAKLEQLEGHYDAISYTWGEPVLAFPLHVDDGSQVCVTRNLDCALRYLRRDDRDRLLWADAASINQTDNEEKAVQIPLMVQIFQSARSVMAWLDTNRDTSVEKRGMRKIATLSRLSKDAKSEPSEWFSEVLRFLSLPWFNRLWIVQEVVFSLDTHLICGDTELAFSRLMLALSSFPEEDSLDEAADGARISAIIEIEKLWTRHSLFGQRSERTPSFEYEQTTHILNLVENFSSYGCTDPRDRIFALYSMATNVRPVGQTSCVDELSSGRSEPLVYMDIDYSLGVRETYETFALACLRASRTERSLIWHAVLLRQHSPRPATWPSWVPDWQITTRQTNRNTYNSHVSFQADPVAPGTIRICIPVVHHYWNEKDVPVIQRNEKAAQADEVQARQHLGTVQAKTSIKSHDPGDTLESQLLQLYRLLCNREAMKAVPPVPRDSEFLSPALDPRYVPIPRVSRVGKGTTRIDDHLGTYHFLGKEAGFVRSSNPLFEIIGHFLPHHRGRQTMNDLEGDLKEMAALTAEGCPEELVSPSLSVRELIRELEQSLTDVNLFSFRDPDNGVNCIGFSNTPLELGDQILPLEHDSRFTGHKDGDAILDRSRYPDEKTVLILRPIHVANSSLSDESGYRLIGSGEIYDAAYVLKRAKAGHSLLSHMFHHTLYLV